MTTPTSHPPDPDADKLSASAFDFLLIELVPLATRLVADVHAREAAAAALSREGAAGTQEHGSVGTASFSTATLRKSLAGAAGPGLVREGAGGNGEAGLRPASEGAGSSAGSAGAERGSRGAHADVDAGVGGQKGGSGTGTGTGGAGAGVGGVDGVGEQEDEELRESVYWRLDALGYRVGQGLVERFSANSPRPNAPLDMIKFICKDLWTLVFRKQIDNLKTNHRGTFVLTDARFMPLARMSVDRGRGARGLDEALTRAQPFLWFPCGVIRGALSGFGLNATVQAETADLKSAVFQIRVVGSKP